MKRFFILTSILMFTVFMAACGDDSSSNSKSDPVDESIDRSIITLPSCISSEGETSKVLKSTKAESSVVNEVYEGIRENVGAVDEWIGIVKSLLKDINRLTGFGSSGSWSDDSAEPGEPSMVVWGPDPDFGYDTKVELWWGDNADKGFEAYVTINRSERTAKGVITWNFSNVIDDDSTNDNLVAQFAFDSTVEPKMMEIKVTGMDGSANPDEPENAWIKITLDENHVFTLSGNYYFQGIDLLDNGNSEDRNYVFTVVGYDEDGFDADHINQAILNLALPVSTLTDTTNMWTNDSVASIFNEAVQQEWDATAMTSIKDWLTTNSYGVDLSSINVGTDLTQAQVIDILEFAESKAAGPADISAMLFILDLVNPAYFMETGFFGTWDGTRGTLSSDSDVPASFSDLSEYTVDVVTPESVKDLWVGFL